MDVKYFHEFLVLAQLCHYQDAAEQLFITPSALSKHIARLEDELGVMLFDRTTRRVRLTPYGVTFRTYAAQIDKQYDKCLADLTQLKAAESGRLSIFYAPQLSEYALPLLLSEFARENDDLDLCIKEHPTPAAALEEGSCSAALSAVYGQMSTPRQKFYFPARWTAWSRCCRRTVPWPRQNPFP